MSPITTHVLDTARGRPAAGVRVELEFMAGDGSIAILGMGFTDDDGRLRGLLGELPLQTGRYRLRFHTGDYFGGLRAATFHPLVEITFEVTDPRQHYHVPLLLAPFGYTTYRGS